MQKRKVAVAAPRHTAPKKQAVKRRFKPPAPKTAEGRLKIMVSSTVYGSEQDLEQIAVILRQQFKYDVVMSKEGNVYVPIGYSPEQACLKAVKDCDLFLGIIFPRYGSGITHKEFLEAIKLNKPCFFLAHEKIEFLRKVLEPLMYQNGHRTDFKIPKTSVLDDISVIDMYNAVRKNWIQAFQDMNQLTVFLETQFKDRPRRMAELIAAAKKNKP